jgi:DNA-binding MarR family transcriptional regulator
MSRDELAATIVSLFRESSRLTDVVDEMAVRVLGINRTDGRILDLLDEGPASPGQIAVATHLTSSATTTAIDRLERMGLVTREVDTADRRRIVVTMTERARRESEMLYGPMGEWAGKMFEEFDEGELLAIEKFLRRGRDLQLRHVEHVQKVAGQARA